jgi:hypothetical protein
MKRWVVIEGGAARKRVRSVEGECGSDQVPELEETTTVFISDGYTVRNRAAVHAGSV